MAEKKVLKDLEVGDPVFYYAYHRQTTPTVQKVTKVTATQVTIDNGRRFSKNGGSEVGGTRSKYYRPSITVWSTEEHARLRAKELEIARQDRLDKLKKLLDKTNWLTEEQIDRIRAIIKESGVWCLTCDFQCRIDEEVIESLNWHAGHHPDHNIEVKVLPHQAHFLAEQTCRNCSDGTVPKSWCTHCKGTGKIKLNI